MRNERLYGHALILIAYVMWGSTGLFVRVLAIQVTTIMFVDACIALVVMLPLLFLSGQHRQLRNPRALVLTLAVAGLTTLCVLLLYRAIQLTTVSNAILSHYLGPVLVFLFAPFFLRERRSRIFAIALVLSIAGLATMMPIEELSFENRDLIGITIGVISAFFFAGSTIGIKWLTGQFSILVILVTTFATDLILTTPFVVAQPSELIAAAPFWPVFILKFVVTASIPFAFYIYGMKRIEAQRLSILGYIEPLASIVLAAVFLAEIPGLRALVGGLLILIAGAWVIIDGSVRSASGLVVEGEEARLERAEIG